MSKIRRFNPFFFVVQTFCSIFASQYSSLINMKHIILRITVCGILCSSLFSSCFKDEAPNAECDITQAYVHVDNPGDMFFNNSDTLINVMSTDSVITFNVKKNADISTMAPYFSLTEGATISPANGSVQDFSNGGVTYTVTSESKAWKRTYTVHFNHVVRTVSDTTYLDFEHYSLDAGRSYYVWQRLTDDGSLRSDWASGNAGFKLSMSSAKPEEYPTIPLTDGFDGKAVQLTTRSTGPFGIIANKRLAAGNLFLGAFVVDSALQSPMKATNFGVVYDSKPIKITGYYKYAPGKNYQDRKGNILKNMTDSAAIYAVLYKNHDADGKPVTLYGNNVKTSEQIVALAELEYVAPVDEWMPFDITFKYSGDVDMELLENRGYNLTIVFSSSKDGDLFCGATGSTLCVDKVRVISTKEN